MVSINGKAYELVRCMIDNASALDIKVAFLENGTTVIDAGIRAGGGTIAGEYFSRVCMGGLAKIDLDWLSYVSLPGVVVSTDFPAISCLASQYAGWRIETKNFFAMGSGPARALARVEDLFNKIDYKDTSEVGVIALEGRKMPNEEVADFIAARCNVSPGNLYILIAPTASIVGSIQVVARVVEAGMHKLVNLGFDVNEVLSGFGVCPIPPVGKDDLEAMCLTNDYVLYGSRTFYAVRAGDEEIANIVDKVPSTASPDYGKSFSELFRGDFYQMDPMLFGPAEITINNLSSGRSFHAGRINPKLLV